MPRGGVGAASYPLASRDWKKVDQTFILWYTLLKPEWRNRQTRATQNRVGLAHVGSIPTSGI
jgi:hypothetical protein